MTELLGNDLFSNQYATNSLFLDLILCACAFKYYIHYVCNISFIGNNANYLLRHINEKKKV